MTENAPGRDLSDAERIGRICALPEELAQDGAGNSARGGAIGWLVAVWLVMLVAGAAIGLVY